MVQGKWYPMGDDLTVPLSLRKAVFGTERDELDDGAWQVVVLKEDRAVGAARLWWADGAFWLGDVGVLEDVRGQGFGDLLMRLLLFKALTHHAALIRLTAPSAVAPFFAAYGFKRESGSTENAVAMCIHGQDVQLSHCGGNCDGCQNRTEACTPKALR